MIVTIKYFTRKYSLIMCLGLIGCCTAVSAQSLDQAKKLYNDGQYEEAKPVFERLVKQSPNNGSYNHWYGVCCFETGDMEGAERYLKIGVTRKVQESFRYLAETYFRLYHFDKASELYEDYMAQLAKKKQDVDVWQTRKDQIDNAQRMVDRVEDIEVIDSVVVDKDAFLSAYVLSEESGSFIPFNQFFREEQEMLSVVYMNQKKDKIYYARQTEENKLCLFTQSHLMDHWGDEKQLPMNINSRGNDNYPFVMADGVTLYYASDENGSLGGYDIFVTRYNTNFDSYLTPEQLGMPYNSPYNDYMLVIDEVKNLGWFVSDRYQPEDKVCVYLFIPNETRARVDGDDLELKRDKAMLADISVTWKEGNDYKSLIELAYEELPFGQVEVEKDFEFIINNDVVYYVLDDINSPEARNIYSQVVTLRKQIDELTSQLDEWRQEYTSGNKSKRQQLSPQILNYEKQLEELLAKPSDLEKRARNVEIAYLQKNNIR